jgi:ketosteroid isomerase-like protein
MKKGVLRGFLAAVLIAAGIWVWWTFFPSAQRAIRKTLLELAKAACIAPNESPLAKAINSKKVTDFCTGDVEITVDIPGYSRQTINGRDELLQAAMGARALVGGLNVEFLDIHVTVGPDKQSAIAELTAKGKVPGDKDLLVQELKFTLKKMGGDWLIQKVETVKTLL